MSRTIIIPEPIVQDFKVVLVDRPIFKVLGVEYVMRSIHAKSDFAPDLDDESICRLYCWDAGALGFTHIHREIQFDPTNLILGPGGVPDQKRVYVAVRGRRVLVRVDHEFA